MDNKPPLEFANRIIRMLVDNMFGSSVMILPSDYTTIRVTFRKIGGLWTKVCRGDMDHCRKVVRVVQSWGDIHQKNKSRKVDVGY